MRYNNRKEKDGSERMNILVAINKRYMPYFAAMIRSLAANNAGEHTVYIATKEVTDGDIQEYLDQGKLPTNVRFVPVRFNDEILKGAKTLKKWPTEVYYRIFAKDYLPENVDRILYLDCDMIVKGAIDELYNQPFDGKYFVATTNIHNRFFRWFILTKNGAKKGSVYANTGVLLMNLDLLRKEQDTGEVLKYIAKRNWLLTLPDQDVISGLYGNRVKIVDNTVFNLSEREIRWQKRKKKRTIDEKWVEENACILHYLSKNKPWKENYKGILKPWYDRYKID